MGRLPGAISVSLGISGTIVAEAGAIMSSEDHPLANGNSETCDVDGTPQLALVAGRGTTPGIMLRR